jgi:hypothetical protein
MENKTWKKHSAKVHAWFRELRNHCQGNQDATAAIEGLLSDRRRFQQRITCLEGQLDDLRSRIGERFGLYTFNRGPGAAPSANLSPKARELVRRKMQEEAEAKGVSPTYTDPARANCNQHLG